MNEIKTITIICAGYPTPKDQTKLPFVDQLVCAWADLGITVSVICPIMRFIELKDRNSFYKKKWIRRTGTGKEFYVYHPRYFGFGAIEEKNKLLYNISYQSFTNAIKKMIDSIDQLPDVLYSHFLTSGRHAGDLSREYGIPGFCAFGESTLWSVNSFNYKQTQTSIGKLKGIISVSSDNKKLLVQSELYPENRICVIPNAINTSVFFQHDKHLMRQKYGFSDSDIIGIFVGAFSERKGVLRTQAAALKANQKMIYIGDGDENPIGDNILFKGKVPHSLIAEYLSAADCFILPTKAEGCCNAIIEAIACGLPVISSDLSFNDDILNEEYSIRIDPDDIKQIQNAMEFIASNTQKRAMMSAAAIEASKHFSIEDRAKKIISFMES